RTMDEQTDHPQTPPGPAPLDPTQATGTIAGPPKPDDDRYSAPGFVLDPQRLLRIAGVTREVLEEARRIRPEAGAVDHLRRVHSQITDELKQALPPPLWDEREEHTPGIRDGSVQEGSLAH